MLNPFRNRNKKIKNNASIKNNFEDDFNDFEDDESSSEREEKMRLKIGPGPGEYLKEQHYSGFLSVTKSKYLKFDKF
jgi:hypothetical protein